MQRLRVEGSARRVRGILRVASAKSCWAKAHFAREKLQSCQPMVSAGGWLELLTTHHALNRCKLRPRTQVTLPEASSGEWSQNSETPDLCWRRTKRHHLLVCICTIGLCYPKVSLSCSAHIAWSELPHDVRAIVTAALAPSFSRWVGTMNRPCLGHGPRRSCSLTEIYESCGPGSQEYGCLFHK